ncbi:MAG TPA: TetR/AcrR family transcriptional regulator [Solirubrobacteraceae bacterium]|jgi:AcrR family transcriptional regulator
MGLAHQTSGTGAEREGSRSERRKARTATAIRDAAERLFISRGYSATTMEELAEEADVAVGSIYAHFGSKEGVYSALIERALELDKQYCDEGFLAGTVPAERLLGLAEGYLRFAREHPAYFQLFRFPPSDRPGAELTPTASARVAQRIKDETKRMAGEIQQAIREGIARPVDAESTARFLWAAWDGVICSHLGPGNMGLTDKQFEAVLDRSREVFALGLFAAPQP